MDIVAIGGSRGINDIADTTSRLGSIVQINSIAIDISSSMEAMKSPLHEHFSIRGFVAGMRSKDRTTCFPYASEGNDLPPLDVPEFRWWQCSSCIPKDEMKRTTEEMVVGTKSDANTSSFENGGDKNEFFIHRTENTGSKAKTDISDIKAGTSRDMPEVNQQQDIERLYSTPDRVCLADRTFYEVEERDNASSGSDGTFSVLPHRKKPKLRYLADILVEERNHTSINPRTRSSSSCGMESESVEMEAGLVPELESADVAKTAQCPERKRKTALEEDREPLVSIRPKGAAKRIKGLVLDAEKNSRRVKISDPECKGVASMRLDLPRTQQIKPKKAKAIDANKMMRRIRRGEEIARMREYLPPNNASSINLQEQVVPVETNLGKLGGAPSILVEMGCGFRSSPSAQQMEKSDLSMAKMPAVGADDDYLWPPRKSILKNCNIRGTLALDLSLNSFMDAEGNHNDQTSFREHRRIPDLNVEYPGKMAMTEELQSTILTEKRSLPVQKALVHKKDASASCSHGPSDDIPMEIVELLARNQHERALGNSRRHMLGVNDTMKGYPAIVKDGRPSTASFPPPGRINGLKVANGNMGVKSNKCQMDMSKLEKNHFRPLSSSTPRKPDYSTSACTMAGPSSSTWEELIYSYVRETAPLHLSIPQSHPIRPTGVSAHSFLDERHKERTVGNTQGGKGKKAVADVGKLKEVRIRSNCTSGLDPYSNETIPALQLLSLMDQQVKSGSSYEVGAKSSLDKPFSPCKHHPRINGKKNRSFLRGPFFPQNSSSKDFSLLGYGVYSSGETSFRSSSNLRGQEMRNSKTTPLEGSSGLQRWTERSHAVFGDCTLNRNPADFSIPEVGNEFTINSKDLRPRKRNSLKGKSRSGNMDGKKRERMRKIAKEKECPR